MFDKKKLMKRYTASYETKDKPKGRIKKSVLDFSKLKDRKIEFYQPQEGKNRINILPYEVKSKNHPDVARKELSIGDYDYKLELFVHRGIGVNDESVICLKQFNKPCPICEKRHELFEANKTDEAANLKPSRRVFYNVQDLKDGKVKVFETSHYLFERELIEASRDDDEGGFNNFAGDEDGCVVTFKMGKEKLGTTEYNAFKNFSFSRRDEKVTDEIYDQAISLDELIVIPTYEEVEKMLNGSEDEEDSELEETKTDSYEDEEIPPRKTPEKAVEKPTEKEQETAKKSNSRCPFGHVFGVNVDDFDDCEACDMWEPCQKEHSRIKK